MEPDNIPYHIPTAFRKGNRVKVVAEVKTAHAWHAEWNSTATKMVGQTVLIREVHPLWGYWCEPQTTGLYAWLPSPALESLYTKTGPCVIEVPSV